MKRATKLAAAKREHDEILAREVLTIYKIKPTEYRKMLQNTNSEYSIGYTKENLLEWKSPNRITKVSMLSFSTQNLLETVPFRYLDAETENFLLPSKKFFVT